MFTQLIKWIKSKFTKFTNPKIDEHDNEFRIVKQVYLDDYLTELVEEYTLEQRVNFSWRPFKEGFRTQTEALEYYYKVQEYVEKTGVTVIQIKK